jgi:hypothetical protein
MMQHIDVSRVLRQTVACDLYSNLVTRPTGAAVRAQIEALLREAPLRGGRALAVIDFSHVRMIDFSCADEVIAKLVLPYCESPAADAADAYFVFRGVSDEHWDAIEAVLERHELALVLEEAGEVRVAGVLAEDERMVWGAVARLGSGDAAEVTRALATQADRDDRTLPSTAEVARLLERLHRRRVLMRLDDGYYVAVGAGALGDG